MRYKHGDATKEHIRPLFSVWRSMLSRCSNPNGQFYARYGGRGISVCPEWKSYVAFREWAQSNNYIHGLTIDRIDNDGDYCPENCRFVDRKVQARNRKSSVFITCAGKRATLAEWADIAGVSLGTLWARLNKLHWSVERAVGLEFNSDICCK